MPEVSAPASVVVVDYICDECKEGKMMRVDNGFALLVHPPKYAHKCDKCGHTTTLTQTYPTTRIVRQQES